MDSEYDREAVSEESPVRPLGSRSVEEHPPGDRPGPVELPVGLLGGVAGPHDAALVPDPVRAVPRACDGTRDRAALLAGLSSDGRMSAGDLEAALDWLASNALLTG